MHESGRCFHTSLCFAGPGGLNDGSRSSLRLAVAALARHPIFEEDLPCRGDCSNAADIIEAMRSPLAVLVHAVFLAWELSEQINHGYIIYMDC